MSQIKKILVVGVLMFLSIVCDQTTKYFAVQNLQAYEVKTYAGDTFRLMLSKNSGGFLSLGGNLPERIRFIIFSVFVAITLVGLLLFVLLSSKLHPNWIIGFSLFLGGGSSNLIDRLVNNGFVIDFMNVGIGNIRTGIFNVADMIIILGFMIILFNFNKTVET